LVDWNTTMTDDPKIPLCRAEFLQDISIELGRRFATCHPFRSFTAAVDTCEHDGGPWKGWRFGPARITAQE